MSDIIDVQNTLVGVIANAAYPNGTGQASVSGNPIVVYAGWPTASRLDADLIAGKAHITVFPTATESNKTRYPRDWVQQSVNTATVTATIAGQTVVIGGAMPSPFTAHNIMAMVNHQPYVYAVQSSDTLTSIATALAVLIAAGVPGTTSAGTVITMPGAANITVVRVGVTGTSIREIRRQERVFQLTVWANTPSQRDVIGSALDISLANTEFLTLPDGYGARLIYRSSNVIDGLQKAKLYRRDFMYAVEYATTQTEVDAQITQTQLNTSVQNDGATQYTAPRTTYF
ncbi:hypothetical protein [Glaciimonas sp. PCH181]|uniref:hypothetical protein n=1 Tax=Glaciimonas sp. PCH181 TaxID=2133943 RepID=UPI000D348C8E|nr:hypothetical protein [Glaciimonas sp. PCH181]PUA19583.1 hypothetical protein C7W93_06985 [Glaciimonas sp. PCH181]